MIKKFTKIFMFFSLVTVLHAGDYAADFINIGVGARANALGGAFSAIADDATSFYWNPAGLSTVKSYSVHLDHMPMFNGLSQYNAFYGAAALSNKMTVGGGWIRLGVDDIPRFSDLQGTRALRLNGGQFRSSGEPDGYFSDSENAFLITVSRVEYMDVLFNYGLEQYRIPIELYYGFSAKYFYQKIDVFSGSGQSIDFGAMLRFVGDYRANGEEVRWLSVGFSAIDLAGTNLVWNTPYNHKDAIPSKYKLGFAGSRLFEAYNIRLTFSQQFDFGLYNEMHTGLETVYLHHYAVRLGYAQKHLTTGAGIRFRGAQLDYAFIGHDLAQTHQISIAYIF